MIRGRNTETNGKLKSHFRDDVFEMTFPPSFGRMVHHGDDGVVVFFVFIVKEYQLGP